MIIDLCLFKLIFEDQIPFICQANDITMITSLISRILSWIVVGLLVLLSMVPLRILLFFSPALAFFVRRVIGYRRAVVLMNLRRSFPDKGHDGIAAIERQFYLHFADLFFETISLLSASRRAVAGRCVADPAAMALLKRLAAEGRSVICLAAHLGNWECHLPAFMNFKEVLSFAVYRPLSNRAFDWLLSRIRLRFGDGIIHDRQVARSLVRLKKEQKPAAFGLVSDQSPGNQDIRWLDFMSQDTAVYSGPERLARMFRLPVVFMFTRKSGRGRYVVHVEMIAEHPEELPEGEVTARFFSQLEREIRRAPAFYLWSHRRWKKKRQ